MAAARNRFVAGAYGALELTDFRAKTLALPWASERSAAGHTAVVSAIAARDPVAARQAMADHLYALYTRNSRRAAVVAARGARLIREARAVAFAPS